MRPVRTIVTVLFAATIAITGCTHPRADQPAPPPPVPNPSHLPTLPTHRTDPTPDDPSPDDPTSADRHALIYTAVLRHYLTSGDAGYGDTRFPHIFALDHTAAGAGGTGQHVAGGGPIPRAVQRSIIQALTDVGPLSFVGSGDAVIQDPRGCAHVRGDGILITLGPVDGGGDQVQVGLNGFRACLGANSLTYLVERTGRGWVVSGITALGPVA
jgi:hypothetical protein